MAITPAVMVSSPEPRGLRYGLFTAATGPLELPAPEGLGGGVTYDPVSCGGAHLYPIECDDTPPAKVFDDANALVTADPFIVYSTYVCSAVGYSAAELEAKVRRRLANGEQSGAEAGLAAVLAAGATANLTPDPTSIQSVVGDLEQWLYGSATANYGNVGYLHAPTRWAQYAAAQGLIIKDGLLYRTHLGTIWVFGGGYPDDGRIYITGQVTVWRAADVVVAPPAQVFNRATNVYRLLAEREYAVAHDCVAAVSVFEPETPLS